MSKKWSQGPPCSFSTNNLLILEVLVLSLGVLQLSLELIHGLLIHVLKVRQLTVLGGSLGQHRQRGVGSDRSARGEEVLAQPRQQPGLDDAGAAIQTPCGQRWVRQWENISRKVPIKLRELKAYKATENTLMLSL